MGRGGILGIAAVAACLCALVAGAGNAAARTRWTPPAHLTWYWQLQGRVRVENVAASDIDGFDNGAAEVARLHARGQHVICYVDVGTLGALEARRRALPACGAGAPQWLAGGEVAGRQAPRGA